MIFWLLWVLLFKFCSILVGSQRPDDRIIYPTERNETTGPNAVGNDEIFHNGIPESLLIRMSQVKDASDFLQQFVVPEQEISATPPDGVSFTARRAYAALAAGEIAPFAMCRPERQVVKLAKPSSGGVMLWPPCVRLRRCGGCCTSKLLACRPLLTSFVNITVLQVRYNPLATGSDAFESEGRRVVTLEQHDRCACSCKQTAEECIPGVQEYRPAECRCACIDQARAMACVGPERVWDAADCTCKCRDPTECSTGFFYSFRTCRCEAHHTAMLAAIDNEANRGEILRYPGESSNRSNGAIENLT